MFGIGAPELLVILVVALVVLGPQRLPELARSLGRAMSELRRASLDIKEEFENLDSQVEDGRAVEPSPEAVESPIQKGTNGAGEKTA